MKAKRFIYGTLAFAMVFCSTGFLAMAEGTGNSNDYQQQEVNVEEMTVLANSEHKGAEIAKAFDRDRNTFWDAAWETGDKGLNKKPIVVDVDFNTPKMLSKLVYTPRQDDNPNGMILEYSISGTTQDGERVTLAEHGSWENNHRDKEVKLNFAERLSAVQIQIKKGSLGGADSETAATAAEFTFYESIKPAGISQQTMALTEGESKVLQLTEIAGENISWNSSNPEAVTVLADGTVTGIKEGTGTITGSTQAGETASCEVSVSAENAPELQGKVLVFEDNFNGDTLDLTKWNNWCVDLKESGLFRYGNSPDVAVHPDNAYVSEGTLRLLGSKEETVFDGVTSNYRSAMVQTRDKFEEKYGYVEAMVKIPNVPGSNPAVWTMPQADEANGGWLWGDADNFGAEIDILERPHPKGAPEHAGLAEKYWITMHYDNYTYDPHEKFHAQPTIKDPYKWHKFGMEWTPEYINFLLDGEVVATQENNVPNTPEIFILSYGLGGWIGTIADEYLPAEMEVDYVRWYKDIVPPADKSALQQALDSAKTYLPELYTADSFEVLKSAIVTAKEVFEDENASQDAIDEQVERLEKAIGQLVPDLADLTQLQALYNAVSQIDLSIYTQDSVSILKKAMDQASVVLQKEKTGKEEAAKAESELMTALARLDKKEAKQSTDKSLAKILYSAYKELDLSRYTQNSAALFIKAFEELHKVIESQDITQEQADKAVSGLISAAAGLEMKTAEVQKPAAAALKKGQVLTYKGLKYQVTSTAAGKAVVLVKGMSGKGYKKVTVPAEVTLKGVKCRVTKIGQKAFKNNKKLQQITIGKNVSAIGKQAFWGAEKLKKITIKSKVLNKAYSNCLKGISGKAVIEVPKSKRKAYQDLFQNKGQRSGVVLK